MADKRVLLLLLLVVVVVICADVYVVTGARKNHLRKVEYRLSNLEKGDLWVRLRRSEKKTGVPFTINRRVLVLPPSAQIH